MPLGPVFNAELLTTARRPRYYIIRFIYGLIILFQIYLSYQSNSLRLGNDSGQLRIRDMADFGLNIFASFAVLQAVVVILLTPALVGGAIAEEKQRKTLHYLLTSQLTGVEIVLGKLAARLLHVGVLVLLGLPVVSLIGLFGGIDFQILFLAYGATLTTIYFLATASILVSVVSTAPEAISLLYILELGWLIGPALLMSLLQYGVEPWPTIGKWVNPVLEYVAVTSPVFFMTGRAFSGFSGTIPATLWGMGLQVLYGTVFVIVGALRLRPSYRNEGATSGLSRKLAKVTGKRSWFPRPACGDDAMLWKEMYVSRTSGLTKAALVTLGVSMVGVIGYFAFGLLADVVHEMSRDGYFTYGTARRDFNYFLRTVSTAIYLLWLLGIASASASGISSEREEDLWTSLTATPLSGREILRAKMIGPVWSLRLIAGLLFLLWGVGLVVGSIHPFGLVACLVEFIVFTWFLTALGTMFSLRAKNSTRSLASTMALLIFINGGYLFCCIPFQSDTPLIGAGSTPFIFAISLLSVQDFGELPTGYKTGEFILACVMGVTGYGIAAACLTASLFTSFDAFIDRPDRFRQDRNQQREYLKGSNSKEIQFQDELV